MPEAVQDPRDRKDSGGGLFPEEFRDQPMWCNLFEPAQRFEAQFKRSGGPPRRKRSLDARSETSEARGGVRRESQTPEVGVRRESQKPKVGS